MNTFLCIDLGSSGVKVAIINEDGSILGMGFEEYRFVNPQPFWSEIDPNTVWEKTCKAIKNVNNDTGVDKKTIKGISISMIGETIMALDEKGNPIYPAIESMDARGGGYTSEIGFWKDKVGIENIFKITSYPLSSLASANKLLWLKNNKPDIYNKVAHFCTFQDFAVFKMTGNYAIDYSMASRTMLFDIKEKNWSTRLLEIAGFDDTLFSTPHPAFDIVGELTESAAKETDLVSGIPVVVGAHDQACASLGVGIYEEGTVMDGTGSVEAIIVPTTTPIADLAMLKVGHGSQCHVTEDVYLGVGFQLTAGLLVRWFKDQIALKEQACAKAENKDVYDLITERASKSNAGANGLLLLPHFRGAGTGRTPPLNPNSKGAFLGLTLSHTRDDIARAVFEGITFETRMILSSMEKSGIDIKEIRVTGGGAKSDFWLQLKANMTGKKVVVPAVTEASLLGVAQLVGVGVGVYKNLAEAVERTVSIASEFDPSPSETRVYDGLYAIYQEIYPAVEEINTDLTKFLEEKK